MSTIVITGASRGIGLATALELARAGHTVFATMRNPAASPELAVTAAAERLPVEVSPMDVDDDQSVARGFGRLLAHGPIDVLINNAGVEAGGSVEETPLELTRAVMETNYFGALRAIKAVLPAMRARRSGCIVNVTSVAGRLASGAMSSYSASKWALEAASEALAQEVSALGIRVAIIEPGIIDTRMARNVETWNVASAYPHARRMAAMFNAALGRPQPAAVVARKIREVIESGSTVLRHPAGDDAAPLLAWRASLSDEQWAAWGAQTDDEWVLAVKATFGMDVTLSPERPEAGRGVGSGG
jgi:NAD(P)-dependent dehydrogenase (short-subunit alcohol dehydrogenase family)